MFTFKTVKAPAVEVGSLTVTPVARSLAVGWGRGAVAWSWPCAVLVSREGRTSRIRIVNVNRLAEAGIVAVAAVCAYGLLSRATRPKE